MTDKTIDEYFRDWEGSAFGFGYGSGEPHVLAALRGFMELCNEGTYKNAYDYQKLEAELSPTVAWLLINVLCRASIIEYGTSPRAGWLTDRGEKLRDYMLGKTADELVNVVCDWDCGSYDHCYPDHCNCDGPKCANPFWKAP